MRRDLVVPPVTLVCRHDTASVGFGEMTAERLWGACDPGAQAVRSRRVRYSRNFGAVYSYWPFRVR
jgi:hypothetical protein